MMRLAYAAAAVAAILAPAGARAQDDRATVEEAIRAAGCKVEAEDFPAFVQGTGLTEAAVRSVVDMFVTENRAAMTTTGTIIFDGNDMCF